MEYAIQIEYDINNNFGFTPQSCGKNQTCDDNFTRFVGWKESNICIKKYFSQETVNTISTKLSDLLQGVDPKGRPIIVPDKTICSVMSQVFTNYRPATKDIYGRYNVPSNTAESYVQSMIDQTIEIIFSDVLNNLGMDEVNSKLSAWNTVLGDFNENGLRSHPVIKIREKRPNFYGNVSFMNY